MPELPEVQTIVSDINKHLTGFTIKDVGIEDNYLRIFPNVSSFCKKVVGQKILKATRIGKNILIGLEDNLTIGIHLAMTGRLLLQSNKNYNNKWTKVTFTLQKGAVNKRLMFSDVRKFGKVALYTKEELQKLAGRYGPDPINSKISPEEFHKQIIRKKTSVKSALLNQQLISGLGNIYVTDTLFLAELNPETNTRHITKEITVKILEAAVIILSEGIAHRGSTLKDKMYVDLLGDPGSQQNHFRVYAQELCPKCKNKITYKKIGGRGTYYCQFCQKLPVKPGSNVPDVRQNL